VTLLGSASLLEYAFGLRLGIDQLLFRDRSRIDELFPGRPAAGAALGLLLIGAALLTWNVRLGRWWPSSAFAWLAALLGLTALTGYATGWTPLLTFSQPQPIAMNSAVSLALLPVGMLLARSDRGAMKLLASERPAGALLRRLLAIAVAVPLGAATMTLAGERLGLFSTKEGAWLFASAVSICFGVATWVTARSAERMEQQRKWAFEDREEAQRIARIGSWSRRRGQTSTWSAQLFDILGCDPQAGVVPEEDFYESVHPEDRERVRAAIARILEHEDGFEIDYRLVRPGLMNRRKFEFELERHVSHVKRYGPEGALLVLDLDNFKSVNDMLGHSAGDQLIISTAGVIRARLRDSDTLARLGGDEFAVLLPRGDRLQAAKVADTLVAAVRGNSVVAGGERRSVTTSIGVMVFDADMHSVTGESALIDADLAMYDAKEAGRDRYAFSATTEHRTSDTKARLTWVNRIEHALEHDRFALLAQPILDLQTHRVRQHELLIRMLDDQDELIPPASFLTVAERSGLISQLDQWVVTHAIELIEQHPELQLEVNISGVSLGDPQLLRAIESRMRESAINPTQLIFEVTETAAVANITHAQAFAQRLREHGCRFALDDFGAGFGSFYYLKHLPFDYVKIDGEFVQHAASGHIDQLVIEAVVRIAQGLGKETIAEFVTDEKTQRVVTRLGVDYAQGYHIGRPVPIGVLLASLGDAHLERDDRAV